MASAGAFSGLDSEKSVLMHRVTAIEKYGHVLKHEAKGYARAMGDAKERVDKLVHELSFIEHFRGHNGTHKLLEGVLKSMTEMSNQLQILEVRSGPLMRKDMKDFLVQWKLVKEITATYCGVAPTNAITKIFGGRQMPVPPTKESKVRNAKEKNSIESKIHAQLDDLQRIVKEFVHAQMYYHAKSLETWSKCWETAFDDTLTDDPPTGELEESVDTIRDRKEKEKRRQREKAERERDRKQKEREESEEHERRERERRERERREDEERERREDEERRRREEKETERKREREKLEELERRKRKEEKRLEEERQQQQQQREREEREERERREREERERREREEREREEKEDRKRREREREVEEEPRLARERRRRKEENERNRTPGRRPLDILRLEEFGDDSDDSDPF